MVLYISYYNDVQKCLDEFPTILEKGGQQMLLYYTEDGPLIANSILEYISDGRIKVKKLPFVLEKSYPLILYDIGMRRNQEPDTEFMLWGKTSIEEIYRLLLSYDMQIRGKIKFKKIEDFKKKAEGQKKFKNQEVNVNKRQKQQESPVNWRIQSEEKHQKKFEDSEKFINDENKKKKFSDSDAGNKKQEKSKVEMKNTNLYEKANQYFQELLKEILGETPSDTDTNYIMTAILDVHDIVQKEEMVKGYEESLKRYFPSERRANYYFKKTQTNLEKMRDYIVNNPVM